MHTPTPPTTHSSFSHVSSRYCLKAPAVARGTQYHALGRPTSIRLSDCSRKSSTCHCGVAIRGVWVNRG